MTDRSLETGWVRLPLADVADVVMGQSPPGSSYNTTGDGLPFYQGKAEFGPLFPTARKWCSAPTKVAEPGDVLLSVRAPVGPTNLCPERSAIGRGLAALRPRDGVPSKYLLYALQASEEELRKHATGTTFEAVSGEVVRNHLIPLAPRGVREHVVQAVEEHLTRLDAAAANLRSGVAKLERYRDLFLQLAVTGQRHPLSPRFADGTHPVPERWRWTRLGEIAEIVGGITKDAKKEARAGLVEVPYLRVANVQRGYLDLANVKTVRVTPEEVDALRLRAGDVLFNEGGDRDKLGRGWIWSGEIDPCIHQNHVFRARLRHADIDPRFVSWYANAMGQAFFISHGRQTTNLASISKTQLAKFPIPIPPPDEQESIVKEIERQLSIIDELRREVGIALRRASALSRAVLGAAFAGRLEGSAA